MMTKTLAGLATLLLMSSVAIAQEYTVRLPNVDPPLSKVGDLTYPNHTYAMMRTFKDALESLSGGRIAVELYPSGTLGDLRENLEAVQAGVLEAATPNEATVSGFFPKIQLTTIPYVFPNAVVAWDVLDGPWGPRYSVPSCYPLPPETHLSCPSSAPRFLGCPRKAGVLFRWASGWVLTAGRRSRRRTVLIQRSHLWLAKVGRSFRFIFAAPIAKTFDERMSLISTDSLRRQGTTPCKPLPLLPTPAR